MTAADLRAIERALKRADVDPDTRARVERTGSEGFDFIRNALSTRSLTAQHQLNALSLLSLITRHGCPERKDEVIDAALQLLERSDIRVRSGAALMAINTFGILKLVPSRIRSEKYKPGAHPSLREILRAALQTALEKGIEEQHVDYVRRFLTEDEEQGRGGSGPAA